MDLEKIAELVSIVEKSSLTEFCYKEGDTKITMSKKLYAAEAPLQPAASCEGEYLAKKEENQEEENCFITSPIVGTFYSAAAPDVPAFVKVGDIVKGGQTVCILEAMKLMNEIESDFDCEIEAILVSNEQKVEYGQPLFRVRKL